MNAVFLLTWAEPDNELDVVVGVFATFTAAAKASVDYVEDLAKQEVAEAAKWGECHDESDFLVVKTDHAGVAFATDGHGRRGGKCTVTEYVVRS